MDLEKAYNKIDNFCCSNHNTLQGNKVRYLNDREETIDMFRDYQETKDDDFCKDVTEMVEALDTIKNLVDLQKEFGCPLDIVLKIKFGDIHHVYDENGDKFCINWGEIFKGYFSVYRGTDFDFTVKILKWEDYRKTWWIKKDRSE